ncbi:tail fiber assembly protein [Leminorella grimontii]|uniref:tail fiber assembly protein n=1 Tax=Leminorella grimontii TaxID=82981 RepID=UPI003220692C
MKKYVYSSTSNAFYPVELRSAYEASGTWPIDAVTVDEAVFNEFSGSSPEGKIRATDNNGFPCWIESPSPSQEQLIAVAEVKKRQLMMAANALITPIVDAIDLGIVTTEELRLYDEWRRYRVLLSRVDTSASPVNWPTPPVV